MAFNQYFLIEFKDLNHPIIILFNFSKVTKNGFQAPSLANIGERTELGIRKGHAYHVTDIKKVYLGETTLRTLFR